MLMLRKLKYLDFGYSHSITDGVILGIANSCISESLERISLRLLRGITIKSIYIMLDKLRKLKALDISGCRQLECRGIFQKLGEIKIEKLLIDFLQT